ncbi:MAG: SAM-dependent methyltransferase, partial [Alphaproteobacteria bacterium]|nr:SAM-dependent methyltransferase [Alphaproteobacteria bacterium]
WRAAQLVPDFCQAVKIEFVETSPVLRRQQAAIMPQSANITWHADINSLPKAPCIIIANEFFDALPIKQFIKTANGWQERKVDWQNNQFTYTTKNPALYDTPSLCDIDKTLNIDIAAYGAVQIGDVIEYNPIGQAIMAQSARHICTYGGALLVIDYGYSKPIAGDSLQAVKQHKPIDPLAAPGEADLTAHVNFAALQTVAEKAGAKTYGPIAQGSFLQQLGIEARFASLKQAQAADKVEKLIAAQHRLTAPDQMGALFKALAITHPTAPIPAGFAND